MTEDRPFYKEHNICKQDGHKCSVSFAQEYRFGIYKCDLFKGYNLLVNKPNNMDIIIYESWFKKKEKNGKSNS